MRWYRIMTKNNVPKRLWNFGYIWVYENGNLSVSSSRYANGRTPMEIITGETPDISEYTDFSFYDWVTFKQNAGLGEIVLDDGLVFHIKVWTINVLLDLTAVRNPYTMCYCSTFD